MPPKSSPSITTDPRATYKPPTFAACSAARDAAYEALAGLLLQTNKAEAALKLLESFEFVIICQESVTHQTPEGLWEIGVDETIADVYANITAVLA